MTDREESLSEEKKKKQQGTEQYVKHKATCLDKR